jgi:MFS family permease
MTDRGSPRLGTHFRNLFTANLGSSLGDGIARTAAPLLAVQLTSDPLLVAGVAALQMVPWLLFAIPAGLIIDAVDRRHALALANSLRALLAIGLLVLAATGTLTIWWLYVVIFLFGIGETVYDGAIRAVVPSIVPKALLPRANGRIEGAETVVQNFVAGPLTSVLFAVTVLIPLGANVAAYALAAVLAFALPTVASGRQFAVAPPAHREPWHRALAEGFRFIFGNRMLVTLLFLSTFVGLCFSAATASFVLFLVERLGLPEALFGAFLLTGIVPRGAARPPLGLGPNDGDRQPGGDRSADVRGTLPGAVGHRRRLFRDERRRAGLERARDVAAAEHHPGPAARPGARKLAHRAVGVDAARRGHRRAHRPRRPRPAVHRRWGSGDGRRHRVLPLPQPVAESRGCRQR